MIEGDWTPERLERVTRLVLDIYRTVEELNDEFEVEGKRFTPDGVMVGHLGEVLAAYAFDLILLPCSTRDHDAKTRSGDKLVQIKMTGGRRGVAFRGKPDYLIVLQFLDGTLSVIYNGEGDAVWKEFEGKTLPTNGQFPIPLTRLRTLNASARGKLPLVRELPCFSSSEDAS